MKTREYIVKFNGRSLRASVLENFTMVTTLSDGIRLTRNEHTRHENMRNELIARARLSYRLKQWLLSLRWVNNWRWRRGNKVSVDYNAKWTGYLSTDEGFHESWGYWYDKGVCVHGMNGRPQNTAIFPNYPSIRELSQEI